MDVPIGISGKTDQRIAVDVFHTNQANPPMFKTTEKHDRSYQADEHRGLPIPTGAEPVTSMIFSMAQILYETPDWTLEQKIPGTTNGKVILHVETCKEQHDDDNSSFFFQIRGFSLPNPRRNFLERPDYFFEIFRQFQDSWRLVYRSSVERGSLSPVWPEGQILVQRLCNYDLNRELLVRISDMEGNIPKEIGSFQSTAHGIMGAVSNSGNCDTNKSFPIMNGDKKMGCIMVLKASLITPGAFVEDAGFRMECNSPMAIAHLVVADSVCTLPVQMSPPPESRSRGFSSCPPTFQQYAPQCSIDWCIAIDFTEANGDVRLRNSAHYRTGQDELVGSRTLNDYEWTLTVLGETLKDYNPVHEYPVWGFGGSFYGRTHSIFQCGLAPKARGLSGVLQAYETAFATGMALGKACSMDQILQAAAHHSQKQLDNVTTQRGGLLSYTVLTVLMVGSESDVMAVKEKLSSIRGAPLSVFFINMPRGGRLEDSKLRIYMESCSNGGGATGFKNCTVVVESSQAIAQRDSKYLSRVLITALHEQLPAYFQSQGIAPPMM